MFDEVNASIDKYLNDWQQLVDGSNDKAFFGGLKPTAIGWKVADGAAYEQQLSQWRPACNYMVETWMNDRWIAKLHLKDGINGGIKIVKLMQRRPGSDDALGLDHFDWLMDESDDLEAILKAEPNIKWTQETNGPDYGWISVWFAGTEAKIKPYTVIDRCILDLQALNKEVKEG